MLIPVAKKPSRKQLESMIDGMKKIIDNYQVLMETAYNNGFIMGAASLKQGTTMKYYLHKGKIYASHTKLMLAKRLGKKRVGKWGKTEVVGLQELLKSIVRLYGYDGK